MLEVRYLSDKPKTKSDVSSVQDGRKKVDVN